MTFTLAFVDSNSLAPTTRLDLMGTGWRTSEGTDFGVASLRRAVAGTLLADGEIIPAAAYANRTITLALDASLLTPDDAAAQLQLLSRELDRPSNFLRYQPGTSQPVFFSTLRADFQDVTWDPVTQTAVARIPAAPFAYGPEESIGSLVLYSDPAIGIYIDVNTIKGDVETPLLLATHREFTGTPARQGVFGVRRDTSAITATFYQQAESLTLETADTTTQTVAGYSGGAPNCVRVAFTTTTANVKRLSGFLANLGSLTEPRGRYRVYARVKKSVAGDTVTMQLGWGNTAPAAVLNDTVTLPATTNTVFVDLGYMSTPFGPDPVYRGYSGTELYSGSTYIEVYAARPSGTGNVEIDFLALVPADDQLSLVSFPAYGGLIGPRLMWDGPQETVCLTDGGYTTVDSAPATPIVGAGALMVSPGRYNRIVGLYDVTPGAATTLGAETYTASYYPRYLSVARPVST